MKAIINLGWTDSESSVLMYLLANKDDAVLLGMIEALGKNGALAYYNSSKKDASTVINIEGGSHANIVFGNSYSGQPVARPTSGTKASKAPVTGWVEKGEKAYLKDRWIAIFKEVNAKLGKAFMGSRDGATISFACSKYIKSDVAWFDFQEPNSSKGVVIPTEKLLYGQGPKGFVTLTSPVAKLAKERGYILCDLDLDTKVEAPKVTNVQVAEKLEEKQEELDLGNMDLGDMF